MELKSVELKPRQGGLERTLVLLHGYGADEHDLLPIAHELDPRLRAISLQAPLSLGGSMRTSFWLRPSNFRHTAALPSSRSSSGEGTATMPGTRTVLPSAALAGNLMT